MSAEIVLRTTDAVTLRPLPPQIVSVGAMGPQGATGATGPAGPGVPVGGTTGQVLAKSSATDYATEWVSLTAASVGAAPATPTVGSSLGTSGTVALDYATLNGTYQTISLAGDITFTTSNLAAGRTTTIRIVCDATQRTFTFPVDWVFVGAKPADIAANKTGVLTCTAFSTTDASCVAAWAVQA